MNHFLRSKHLNYIFSSEMINKFNLGGTSKIEMSKRMKSKYTKFVAPETNYTYYLCENNKEIILK